MSKRTPGPWELDPCGQVTQADGRTILVSGIASPMVRTSESIANARLIAAAPDLLEALIAAVECGMVPKSSAAEGGANRHVVQLQVADQIRAAIAKAEGRA